MLLSSASIDDVDLDGNSEFASPDLLLLKPDNDGTSVGESGASGASGKGLFSINVSIVLY